jgi:hypothetical protein
VVLSAAIPKELILAQYTILTVLINGSHFMASYRLLYSSRENGVRYPWAFYYLPLLLAAYSLVALWPLSWEPSNGDLVQLLLVVNALYLALHYTGQAWGMTASYAFLERVRFSEGERTTFRSALKVLAIWQMVWSLTLLPTLPFDLHLTLPAIMTVLNSAVAGTACAGAFVFARVSWRHGRIPSLRVLLPFFLLHIWYAFLWMFPQALFWVQISHALQYLSFPLRVEINQKAGAQTPINTFFRYGVGLVITSTVVFVGLKHGITFGHSGFEVYWLVLASCINIHHYFIDGCIWKISSPVVRDQLFSHLEPRAAQ